MNPGYQNQINSQLAKPYRAPNTLAEAIGQSLKKTPAFNKKIKNAKKCDLDGNPINSFKDWRKKYPTEHYFDSRLEWYMFVLLYKNKIPFNLKQNFTLQEAFKYQGEQVKKIEMFPDFILPNHRMIIDTKGHRTKEFDIKLKMLKLVLLRMGWGDFRIELPSTQKECQDLIWKLLEYKPAIIHNSPV